jgi:hypothetical protein
MARNWFNVISAYGRTDHLHFSAVFLFFWGEEEWIRESSSRAVENPECGTLSRAFLKGEIHLRPRQRGLTRFLALNLEHRPVEPPAVGFGDHVVQINTFSKTFSKRF